MTGPSAPAASQVGSLYFFVREATVASPVPHLSPRRSPKRSTNSSFSKQPWTSERMSFAWSLTRDAMRIRTFGSQSGRATESTTVRIVLFPNPRGARNPRHGPRIARFARMRRR